MSEAPTKVKELADDMLKDVNVKMAARANGGFTHLWYDISSVPNKDEADSNMAWSVVSNKLEANGLKVTRSSIGSEMVSVKWFR